LPRHLWWSGEPLVLDIGIESDRIRLYEIVLTEGSDDDIREFISYDVLIALWDRLYVPRYVREAWNCWFTSEEPK
jgi:hypothetical protein